MSKCLAFAALLLTPTIAAPLAAQQVSPVQFQRGATSTVVSGTIVGRQYRDYTLSVRAGQDLSVAMAVTRGSPYFNVMAPGAGEVAVYNSSMGAQRWQGRAERTGVYTIRVYQMRASGRRGEAASYRLTMSAAGRGAMGGGGHGQASHPWAPSSPAGDAMVPGTPYHASAPVRCRVDSSGRWGQCKAGVVRRSSSSATVHLDTLDGGERTILFRDGRAVSSDAEGRFSVTRRGDTSIIQIGEYETYEIPDALPFGG